MALVLAILKILGLLLTGAFGVIGLFLESKGDKSKRRLALIGISLSTAVALVAQIVESWQQNRDAHESAARVQKQMEQSTKILTEVNRTLNPLTDVSVTYYMTVPLGAPEFAAYRARLEQGIAQILHGGSSLGFVMTTFNGRPSTISIPSGSALMPQQNEVIPYYVLRYSGLQLGFFLTPIPDSQLTTVGPHTVTRPDLDFSVGTETYGDTRGGYSLDYHVDSKALEIAANDLPSDPHHWYSNNKIVSVPDLADTELVTWITCDSLFPPSPLSKNGELDATDRTIWAVRSQLQLRSLFLRIGTRKLILKYENQGGMKRLLQAETNPRALYVRLLPDSVDTLQVTAQ